MPERSTAPARRASRRAILAGLAGVPLAGCIAETDPGGGDGDPGGNGEESDDGGSDPDENGSESEGANSKSDPAGGGVPPDTAWPLAGRDAHNRGYAPGTTGPRESGAIEWVHDAGTPTMNSSPVVADATVYATGTGDPGGLVALDAETGDPRWEAETPGYVTGAPALGEDAVYVATWGKTLHAFDRETGVERWSSTLGHRVGNAALTLTEGAEGPRLYLATRGDGPMVVRGEEDEEKFESPAVMAVDPADGSELWRYDDFGERDGLGATPAVADGLVLVPNEGSVYAIEAGTGDLAWKRETGTHQEFSPAVVDGTVLVGGNGEVGDTLVALAVEDGSIRWQASLGKTQARVSPAVAEDVAYVAASYRKPCPDLDGGGDCEPEAWGKLFAVDLSTGAVDWEVEVRPDTRSAPAVAGDTVYVGNGHGITAVGTGGEVRWDIAFENRRGEDRTPYVKSSPAVAGGRAFVGASDGHLRAIGSE